MEILHHVLLLLDHLQILEFPVMHQRHNFVDRFHDHSVIFLNALEIHHYEVWGEHESYIISSDYSLHLTDHVNEHIHIFVALVMAERELFLSWSRSDLTSLQWVHVVYN